MLFTAQGEGFGIVIIEAMSKRIPVFAINDGGVSEIIHDEENGILLNSTDPDIIVVQIMNVIRDKALIEKIKNQCAEDVRSRFSIQTCVQQMDKIYQSVM